MANDEVKTIRIVVDASKAVDGGRAAQRALDDIEKNTSQLSKAISGLENTFRNLFAGYLGMQGLRMLGQTADAFIQLQNSLRVTGLEAEQLRIIQDRLFLSANKNGVEVQALGQLFSRLSISQKELGASYEQMLRFVDGVTASLKVQGGSTESAKGALLQLAQAMGSGVVRAEEFNSILEGALPIAQAAAKGIDGMEGSVSKLRAAVVAGTVTSRQFFDGALKGFAETEKMAEGMALTTQAAFVILRNGFTHLVGSLTEASGGGGVLAKAIASVGREMDQLAQRPDIVRGIKEAFDAVSAAIDEALAKIQQFAGWLSKIIGEAGQFARSQTITDIRDSILPQWDKDISAQRTAVLKAERNVQLLGAGDRASGLSADSGQRYFAAQQEQFKAQERLAWMEQQRQGQVDRLARIEYEPTLNALRGNAGPQARGVPRSVTLLPDGGGGGAAAAAGGGKAAENAAEKYAELIAKLNNAREAQNAMTDAARNGDMAFQEQQATLDAQQKLLEIYGLKLGYTKQQLAEVRDRLLDIAQGKAAQAFNEGTTALEKNNVLLEAEIKLRNELPETRAKELAVIKATQDAEKAGSSLKASDVEARKTAIEQNEKLKAQQEELKRSAELWTEPLKQALRDIQSIGADAFDKLLESGKISFEELQTTFMRIIRRMAAEFLALATIRPVMSVLVNAISPSMAQSMGLGGSSSMGGGLLGGSGGGGLFSPGWSSTPIFGGIDDEIAAWSAYGTSAQNAFSLSSMTWGQAAGIGGGLLGMGMGVNSLLSGGGSTGSIIGGAAGILGGGLGIAGALMPAVLGGALGPIGMGIGLLGGILPGLLGGSTPPTITNQTYGQLRYGSGGWFTNGGAWGPSANSSATEQGLAGLGANISGVFGLLGGVKDPSKVWGLSAMNKTVSGQGWSSSSDSVSLVDPSGNQQLWRMNESNMMDTGSAQVAYRSILEGAVGEISENMRKAITQTGQTMGGTSLQAIAETVAEVLAFDDAIKNLGKTVIDAEKAVKAVDDSFAAMYATADKYGLATGELDASKAAARLGVATDFGKSISRGILEITDPKAAALADLDDWRKTMIDNNKYLLDNVTGALDQIVEIEKLYGLKRAEIVEEGAKASLTGLADVIKRLAYGDLSGASAADTLAGLQGTYNATLAKAQLGDQTAVAGLGGAAADLAQFAGSYYGTATPTYQNLVGGLRGSLANVYTAQGGTDPLIAALATVSAQFAASEQDNAELKAEMEEVTTAVTMLTEKLQRLLDKMAA